MHTPKGGVVAYPVIQAYGSPSLENNSDVCEAVLDELSISCVCLVPDKEADPQLAMGLSGR